MLEAFFHLIILIFLMMLGVPEPPAYQENVALELPATSSAQFVRVVDGDTIRVRIDGDEKVVRLIGINTPETVDPRKDVECYGEKSSVAAKVFFTGMPGELVLTADPSQGDQDKYQRLLRYASMNGVDYGLSVLKNGYGSEYTYDHPYARQEEYKLAEKEAREAQRGLWSPSVCVVAD